METKICAMCKVEKTIDNFHKSKRDGYRSQCKPCKSKYDKIWRNNNKEKDLKSKRMWRESNIEYSIEYYKINKNTISEYNKNYYMKNCEKIKKSTRKYFNENKERVIETSKIYYNRIKETDSFKLKKRERMRERYIKKPYLFTYRNILKRHLKYMGLEKNSRTSYLLGYTSTELKNHIESLFKDNMSWENYGKWHIDHIKPISKFSKLEPPSIVNSLNNLQPLWAFENLSKGNKYEQQ
jgi:hypothetical protein